MTPRVIVYRDTILPLPETFVADSIAKLSRYEAWFTGTRFPGHVLVDPDRMIRPLAGGDLTPWQRVRFKATGAVPKDWLDRLRERRPSLLHAHFGTDGVFASPIARQLGIPIVVTFHGFDATIERALGPVWKVYQCKRRDLFRTADRILAVSDFIRSRLIEAGCSASKVERHYLGIDTARFQRRTSADRERVVLFAGRLIEKKGCGDLIEAMHRVQAEADVGLVIIGDGPLRYELERRARGLRSVTFRGACPPDEVREAMERASVFALPSRTARSGDAEGLPIVILEAQSMEVPVVGTRHAGIPEAVVDGETGLLCAEGDVPALASNILRLMGNEALRRRMGAAARQRVVALFDLSGQTARLESIYDEVLAGHDARP